jgi:hypothetical protein
MLSSVPPATPPFTRLPKQWQPRLFEKASMESLNTIYPTRNMMMQDRRSKLQRRPNQTRVSTESVSLQMHVVCCGRWQSKDEDLTLFLVKTFRQIHSYIGNLDCRQLYCSDGSIFLVCTRRRNHRKFLWRQDAIQGARATEEEEGMVLASLQRYVSAIIYTRNSFTVNCKTNL